MSFSASLFARRFGITERDLESYLSEALSAGGEYADLYFEYLATSSIGIDEGMDGFDVPQARPPLPARPHSPSAEELAAHQAMLASITTPLWLAAG